MKTKRTLKISPKHSPERWYLRSHLLANCCKQQWHRSV